MRPGIHWNSRDTSRVLISTAPSFQVSWQGLCLQGLLYYLYAHYVERDPWIQWPEISVSSSPISSCHSLKCCFFVSLLSQIDFRSVGAEDVIRLSDTIKGKGFLGSWRFPQTGSWLSLITSCSSLIQLLILWAVLRGVLNEWCHHALVCHGECFTQCWWWAVVLLLKLIYSLNSAFCGIFIDWQHRLYTCKISKKTSSGFSLGFQGTYFLFILTWVSSGAII